MRRRLTIMANLIRLGPNNLNWKSLTLLFIHMYLLQMTHFSKGQAMPANVYCSPLTDIVPVDNIIDPKGDYRYFPYLIKLTRCRGSVGSAKPNFKKCVPRRTENVTFSVMDFSTMRNVQIIMKNDTACKGACVKGANDCNKFQKWDEKNCICDCQYNSPTQSPCPQPLIHIWNQQRCDCVCPTGTKNCQDPNKVWNGESCGCICGQRFSNRCARKKKVLNEQTCMCEDPPAFTVNNASAVVGGRVGDCVGSVKQSYVVLIAVLELLALVVLFGLFYTFCLWKDNSKFSAMTATLTRKLTFTGCKCDKENQNKPESINYKYNDVQVTAERPESLGTEKKTSHELDIGCYNETIEID